MLMAIYFRIMLCIDVLMYFFFHSVRVAIYLFILWLALLMLSLTEVQVSLLARRINLSLKEVNNTLEHLYRMKSSNGKFESNFSLNNVFYPEIITKQN